ncbi:hypothetical protein T492DRAFT_1068936 [Pavlovales sp. CCMP2436]|nr:hypothetical protein T492DRAFT_1068936 [Pavlovales sp. CCMP2436]|mmetsp:Transcript_22285/g.56491  ORF Transcript_22285/g.56491 Transcript_22285/m.56491 type:complete len:389 (+) Transcript_22285:174-1340(+)
MAPAGKALSGGMTKALGWSTKQARILTGGGRAEELYTAERGFPFEPRELPHFHLLRGTTHTQFRRWLADGRTCDSLVGAWSRPLFTNYSEQTTDADERVFNVQTRSMFIDLRVPTTRPRFEHAGALGALSGEELCLLARQHVFGGYTLPSEPGLPLVCTRHHAADWNFVGVRRPRPNKWRVELAPAESGPCQEWQELAFAQDKAGRSYYMERWKRVEGDGAGSGPSLVLRSCTLPDSLVLLVGDHFAFMRARQGCPLVPHPRPESSPPPPASLIELVDSAVARGDADEARAWLGLQGGHGRVSSGWQIDLCTHPWLEGTRLLSPEMVFGAVVDGRVVGEVHADLRAKALADGADNMVVIDGEAWELFDRSGLPSAEDVLRVLRGAERH